MKKIRFSDELQESLVIDGKTYSTGKEFLDAHGIPATPGTHKFDNDFEVRVTDELVVVMEIVGRRAAVLL